MEYTWSQFILMWQVSPGYCVFGPAFVPAFLKALLLVL
jgi:hypothetical protein